MPKVVIGALALLTTMAVNAPMARAQASGTGVEFALGGGVSIPSGDFDDASKLGWHGLAALSIVPQNLPIGFQIDGSFSRLSDESPDDLQAQLIYGTGNLVYKFKTSDETVFRPYLIGGGGVYNLDVKGDDADVFDGESETKFGLNAGAGFDFKFGSVGLFVEGRFHNVFTDGGDTQFIPITAGVRFGGS